MTALWNDLKYALRVLARSPGFFGVAVLALALGIGATAAIFTLVNAIFLKPLPFPEPQRLVIAFEKNITRPKGTVAFPNYLDWRAQSKVFTDLAAYRGDTFNLSGVDTPIRLDGRFVTAQFFDILGLKPAIGRFFTEAEDKPGANPVVLLTERFWKQYYFGDPNVIGRSMILDSVPRTIIGVLPANYAAFRRDDQVVVPQGFIAGTPWQRSRGNHTGLYALGRLKPGVTLAQAQTELEGIAGRLAKEYAQTNSGYSAGAESLTENLTGWVRSPLQ
ncbi:MAG: ABC transporter permease, partial [Bryobacteraceae bacterium]